MSILLFIHPVLLILLTTLQLLKAAKEVEFPVIFFQLILIEFLLF